MKLTSLVASVLAFAAAGLAGKFTPANDEFQYGDEIKIECAQLGEQGRELTNPDSTLRWISPTCVETRKALSLYYGRDGPIQCSVKADDKFHETMLRSLTFDRPLKCRVARNKLTFTQHMDIALKIDGVRVRGGSKLKRIGGNFNCVFHGQKGNLVAASIYPIVDHPLPETVSGVTTMQFNQRWYEGTGMAVLMANKRHEEEFIIHPVVAVMFCILTACIVYVVGRVYVESSLIPRVLREHGDNKAQSLKEFSDANKAQQPETKKTK
ncbi:hypothetical protein GQ54DRAFT_297900 [Martensiomyces pterosporus]|nr:hypothetical protein GQ54DRAFT_297900 [Martensiomyces pterosporus]